MPGSGEQYGTFGEDMMVGTYSEAIQLTIGAVIGLGLSISMEKHGISLTNPATRGRALGYLSIFCMAWVVGITAIIALFGD